jgi:hypothetical protein
VRSSASNGGRGAPWKLKPNSASMTTSYLRQKMHGLRECGGFAPPLSTRARACRSAAAPQPPPLRRTARPGCPAPSPGQCTAACAATEARAVKLTQRRPQARSLAPVRPLRIAHRRSVAEVVQMPRAHQPVAAVVARTWAAAQRQRVQGRRATKTTPPHDVQRSRRTTRCERHLRAQARARSWAWGTPPRRRTRRTGPRAPLIGRLRTRAGP